MTKYAAKTGVPVARSRAEIEDTLKRYGAGAFMYGTRETNVVIGFEVNKRQIKMTMTMPALKEFERDGRGAQRTTKALEKAHDQACRQRWRALALVVKAKLEAVETGVATFEQEFLPYMVLPGGRTVAEELIPKLSAYYEEGKVPRLLAGTSNG